MPKPSFNIVWDRIVKHQGEIFFTITHLPFSYTIKDDGLYPNRTDFRLSKGNFAKAYNIIPIKGPGVINNTVMGPSYVWGIFNDNRVRQKDWQS